VGGFIKLLYSITTPITIKLNHSVDFIIPHL